MILASEGLAQTAPVTYPQGNASYNTAKPEGYGKRRTKELRQRVNRLQNGASSPRPAPPPVPAPRPAARVQPAKSAPPPLPLIEPDLRPRAPAAPRYTAQTSRPTPRNELRLRPGSTQPVIASYPPITRAEIAPLPAIQATPPVSSPAYTMPATTPSSAQLAMPSASLSSPSQPIGMPAARLAIPGNQEALAEASPAALPPVDPSPTIPPVASQPPALPAPPPANFIAPPPEVATAPVLPSDGEQKVTLFTPSNMNEPLPAGTVLPPEAAATMGAMQTAPAAAPPAPEQLAPETMAILSALPPDVLPPAPAPAPAGDVSIKRIDPAAPAIAEATVEQQSSGSTGMSVKMKPQSMDVTYELERAYNALISGETDQAIRIYEEVLTIDPNERTALFGLATTYHRIGLLDKARPVYGRLLKIDPYNVEALNNFLALVGAEAPHAAIEQLSRLYDDNPDFSPIPAQIALLYQKLGDYAQAARYMTQAAAISPENLAYKYNLAVLYDQAGDKQAASTLYRQLLDAYRNGQELPASAKQIQERLTFLASN